METEPSDDVGQSPGAARCDAEDLDSVPQWAGCQVPRATNELMLFALFSAFGSLRNTHTLVTVEQ